MAEQKAEAKKWGDLDDEDGDSLDGLSSKFKDELNTETDSEPEEKGPTVDLSPDNLDEYDTTVEVIEGGEGEAKTWVEMKLPEPLLKACLDNGWRKPSKIQSVAVPIILANPKKNLLAQAQSGTGKTAAFSLGMLSQLDDSLMSPQAIILAHTRELALQILGVVQTLAKETKLKVRLLFREDDKNSRGRGGRGRGGRKPTRVKRIDEQIVVGVPAKVLQQIGSGGDKYIHPENVKVLIVDEADKLLTEESMQAQVISVMNALEKRQSGSHQILLFSATFSDDARLFCESKVKMDSRRRPLPYAKIEVKKEKITVDKIRQLYIDCKSPHERENILLDIYGEILVGQGMIFVETKRDAQRLYETLKSEGWSVSVLHGNMTLADRDAEMEKFRTLQTKIMVSTNVAGRGLDISTVSIVINYDLPTRLNKEEMAKAKYKGQWNDVSKREPDPEEYLHRIGRTARAGREGVAISFVYDDRTRSVLKGIERHFQRDVVELKDISSIHSLLEKLDLEAQVRRKEQKEEEERKEATTN